MMQHLIIGGSDAGISTALRIKEIDPKAPVMVLVAAGARPSTELVQTVGVGLDLSYTPPLSSP